MKYSNDISVVIGSWGSYNECNERALGSKWICLNDYDDWDEILEELKKQGFQLDGIDEELFIQDVENFPANAGNWDYVNPQELFETLKKSGVLDDINKYEKMDAFCEVRSYDEWEKRVNEYEEDWDDGVYLYPDFDWYDLGYHFIHEVNCVEIPECLESYIDYKRYGEQFSFDGFSEYNNGIIEIGR